MPLAVVLDDVQWASPALWESIQAFAQGLLQQGGLLLLIYRRPEIEHTFGWEVMQTWDRAGLLRMLSLNPLNLDEVDAVCQGHTHIHPDEAHALTGGNPFLMSEWLAEPVIEPPMQRYRTVTAQRLQALAAPARMALEGAAVLGENIPYRLWADVADAAPLALAALSEKLAAQRWLQPSAAGYAFAHDLVRQTVYDDIEPGRRRALHAQAAQAYQAREPDNARSRAFHFDRAGLEAEAAAAHRQSGEQDLARFAFREAQTALHRALVLMPNAITHKRIQTALALAQACENTGDREHQQSALAEALAGARHLQDEALLLQVLLVSGYALEQTGQFDAAEAHLTEALALAPNCKTTPTRRMPFFCWAIVVFSVASGPQPRRGLRKRWRWPRRTPTPLWKGGRCVGWRWQRGRWARRTSRCSGLRKPSPCIARPTTAGARW